MKTFLGYPNALFRWTLLILLWQNLSADHSLTIQPFTFPSESVIGKRTVILLVFIPYLEMNQLIKGIAEHYETIHDQKQIKGKSTLEIRQASTEDSGYYICVAENDISSIKTIGIIISVSGFKDGLEEVKLQQQMKGKSILLKKHASIEDAGFYLCMADNGISKIQTNGIIVSKTTSYKEFRTLFHSRHVCSILYKHLSCTRCFTKNTTFQFGISFPNRRKSNTFLCHQIWHSPFTFSWMKNSQTLTADSSVEIHQLKDFSSLMFPSLTLESKGNYTCKVSNAFGTDFHTEFLNVVVPPKWRNLSKDQEVVVGEDLSLKCEVEGYPVPTVLWKSQDKDNFNAAILQKSSRMKVEDGILEITGVTEEDEGDYICEASNGIGNGISHTIVISVLGYPRIQPFNFPEKLTEGQKTKVLCTVIDGTGPFKFLWYKNDHSLATSPSVTIQNSEEYSMLLFNSLSTDHGGNYSCVVSNSFGRDSYSSQLIINVPPTVVQEPVDQTLEEGFKASFLCQATGHPEPSITWQRDETNKENFEEERIKTFSNGTLIITSVKKRDEGIYKCTISNNIGQDLHKLVSLTVIVLERQRWPSPSPRRYHPSTQTQVLLKNLRPGTPYAVTVLGENEIGQGQPSDVLKFVTGEEEPVGPPTDVWVEAKSSNSILVTWKPPPRELWNGELRGYFGGLQGLSSEYVSIMDSKQYIFHKNGSLVLEGITKDHEGVYKCNVSNGIGEPLIKTIIVKVIGYETEPVTLQNTEDIQIHSNGTLEIRHIKENNEGFYQCAVSNNVGSDLKKDINIKVIGARVGQRVSTGCTTSGGTRLKFEWLKDGKSLAESPNIKVRTVDDVSTIIIENVSEKDTGNYTCVATSDGMTDSYIATLNVNVPPEWIHSPTDKELMSGETAIFPCLVTGKPKPVVMWNKFNGYQDQYAVVQNQKQNNGKSILELKQASTVETGFYICEADNDLPKIQKIFFPDQVITGQRTSATCTAISGTPPMEFKWLKNGHSIKPNQQFTIRTYADYSILFIENVDLSTSGNYSCELTNSAGSDRYTALLEVKEPPKWIKEPRDAYFSSGDNISLECSASGFPIPNVTWMKSSLAGKDILQESLFQEKTQGKSILLKKHAGIEDAGFYICIADNGIANIKTNGIVISISESPKIQPFNLATHFRTGEKVTLLCAIKSGTPPFQFTWMKNSQKVIKDDTLEVLQLKDISTLTIPSLTLNSRGNYTCQVTNNYGSDSHTELLNVFLRNGSHFPKIKKTIVGEDLSFECFVEGYPTPVVKWKIQDGLQELSLEQKTPRIETKAGSIMINGVTEEDEGNYICEASNGIGDGISHTVMVSVLVPPSLVQEPEDQILEEGNTAVFSCRATGFPHPTVLWTRDQENKDSLENERMTSRPNGTFVISNIKKSDEGIYICSVSNNIGQDLRKLVSLNVIVPARFEEKFTMKNVRRGETATLKCEAVGDKPLSITWTKDKAEIDFKKHTRLEKFDRDIEKGLSSELIIRTTDRKDGALYGCMAKNEYGSDERNIKLLVVEVPAQPMDVKVKEAWSRTANIVWSAPYSGNSPITKYIIQYWRDRGGPHRLLEDIIPNTQTQVLLKNLKPGTPYAVTVLGENEIGQGQPSDVLKFVTGEEEPNGPPTDVWVEAKSSNSILVTWRPPPRELWNGELRGYFVGYKVDGTSHPYSFKTVDNAANDSHEYLLTNLMKSNKYNIVVKAYNSAGTGPPSQDLIAKTLDGDVPEPPSFTVVAASESKISLRWGDPPSRNIPVTGYTLHYKKEGGEWYHIPIIASSSKNRFTITGLESSTPYKIYITASNQHGNGEPSDITTVTTSMKGFVIGNSETYVDLSVIVPVAACILAFFVVTIVVIIYYRNPKQGTTWRELFREASLSRTRDRRRGTLTSTRLVCLLNRAPSLPRTPPSLQTRSMRKARRK
ncbi:Down syndrome cell adhesion molecule-like [Argiope bruennichi]|uniref:Down syndrome cell adhesion molecule-like n=1 Tax=Argiope bruennichi TaxID=94029 RepID=A0A8T0FPJ7_ARGBR|nr:Down syndrome cell adhesion molecule-like [Argiope bruennichi]